MLASIRRVWLVTDGHGYARELRISLDGPTETATIGGGALHFGVSVQGSPNDLVAALTEARRTILDWMEATERAVRALENRPSGSDAHGH